MALTSLPQPCSSTSHLRPRPATAGESAPRRAEQATDRRPPAPRQGSKWGKGSRSCSPFCEDGCPGPSRAPGGYLHPLGPGPTPAHWALPCRLWTGLGQLRTGLLRPQPAASLLWGPLGAWLGGSPRWRKWLWTRSEPQRTRIPSLPTLAAAPPCGWQAAETRIQTCELVTITNLVEIPTRPWGEGGGFWRWLWVPGLMFLNIFLSLTHQHNKKKVTGSTTGFKKNSSALIQNFRFLFLLFFF